MSLLAAVVAAVVLAAIAVVQVLAAAGRPVGHLVWGGRHRVLPRGLRIASALSVLLYAAMAALLFARAASDGTAVSIATWVLLGYFTLGVGMNAISRSPAERRAMTPACAVLAVATLAVALGA